MAKKVDFNLETAKQNFREAADEARGGNPAPLIDGFSKLIDIFEALMSGPARVGVILDMQKQHILVDVNGNLTVRTATAEEKRKLKVGSRVLVKESGVMLLDCPFEPEGVIATIKEDKGKWALASYGGQERRVRKVPTVTYRVGDQVLSDGHFIFEKLDDKGTVKNFTPSNTLSWDQIGDLVDAKKAIRNAIKTRSRFATALGKKPTRGVLLFGPPGCGKTLLARAAATEISEGTDGAFVYIKGPELLSKWVGETEEKIRKIFSDAKKYHEEHGRSCVVFIDEAEAILGKRGAERSSVNSTTVPQFLSEWDGIDESGAFIILATNRPNDLDEAVMREGRIDRKIHVTRPNAEAAQAIAKIHLAKVPVTESIEVLARSTQELISQLPHLSSRISGALIAGAIDQAVDLALDRSEESGVLSPLSLTDIHAALHNMNKEYQALT
jgi:ATP-dependent 26S proteasome regulatory subunit